MHNVLSWSDALAYFGDDLDTHRKQLSTAGQTTYGLLTCRWSPSDAAGVANRDGEHAERRLIASAVWQELDHALSQWDPRSSDPMIILLALNRSPCADCAQILAGALHQLERRYALRCQHQHFILASLGYYQGADFMRNSGAPHLANAPSRAVTTGTGLEALRDAGWKLCVLDFGKGPTRRGQELLAFLNGMQ
jgi:hypothetical protein